jgi:plasmid stability protein
VPSSAVEREMRSAEQSARDILRGFVEDHQAKPGRMLAASTLRALLSQHGVSPAEFARAVSYAKERHWLGTAEGMLTLTQSGYAEATAYTQQPHAAEEA